MEKNTPPFPPPLSPFGLSDSFAYIALGEEKSSPIALVGHTGPGSAGALPLQESNTQFASVISTTGDARLRPLRVQRVRLLVDAGLELGFGQEFWRFLSAKVLPLLDVEHSSVFDERLLCIRDFDANAERLDCLVDIVPAWASRLQAIVQRYMWWAPSTSGAVTAVTDSTKKREAFIPDPNFVFSDHVIKIKGSKDSNSDLVSESCVQEYVRQITEDDYRFTCFVDDVTNFVISKEPVFEFVGESVRTEKFVPPGEVVTHGALVTWPYGRLVSQEPKRRPNIVCDEKNLNDEIRCPVFELGNKGTYKHIASYRLRQKEVAPKEKRQALVRAARNMAWKKRDPLRGAFDYEPQVNLSHSITMDPSPRFEALISRITDSFERAVGDDTTGPKAIVKSLTESLDRVSRSADSTLLNKDSLQGFLGDAFMRAIWCVPVLICAYYFVTTNKSVHKLATFAGVTAMLTNILPKSFWDSVKSYWPVVQTDESFWKEAFSVPDGSHTSDYEPQSFCFEPDTMAHLLTCALTFLTCGKSDFMGIARDFSRSMSQYSRSVSGWKDLSIFIINNVERFINFVRSKFDCDKVTLYRSGKAEVDSWCDRVMAIVTKANTGADVMTPENVEALISLRLEGKDLAFMYRFTPEASPMLHKYLGYLDDLCRTCSAAMHMAKGGRAPPVVLALRGDPGVGKTYLTKFVTSYVLSSIISDERAKELDDNFDAQVFQKGTTEYWNGYCGQLATIVDDFGQSVAVPGTDNDWIELIRMNSSWSFPLNFADLENKGKNFFCSKFLLLTTNLSGIDKCLSVINEPKAITRRIDFGYTVVVHPDFAVAGKIDISKVESYEERTGEFPYHAWILHPHRFEVGSDAYTDYTTRYTLRDVLDLVCAKMSSNEQHHVNTSCTIKRMLRQKYERDYQPQGGDFFSGLRNCASRFEDKCAYHIYYKILAIRKFTEKVKREARDWIDGVEGIVASPLLRIGVVCGGISILAMLLRFIVPRVISWFSGTNSSDQKFEKAVKKKTKIPKGVLGDLLDAFNSEDFERIVDDGKGGYKKDYVFDLETVNKMRSRQFGMQPQSNEPNGPRFIYKKITANTVVEADYVPQADMYGDSIVEIAYRNMYQLRVHRGDETCVLGNCLFVRDTCAIMPHHYYNELRHGLKDGTISRTDVLSLTNSVTSSVLYRYSIDEFLLFDVRFSIDRDTAMVRFPRSVRAHRDIFDKFIYDGDVRTLSKVRIRLDTIEGEAPGIHRIRHLFATRRDSKRISSESTTYVLATGFEYMGYTRKGDCGGIVGLEDDPAKQSRRLIGFHVAGEPSLGIGLCNIVTQELLDELSKDFDLIADKLMEAQGQLRLSDPPISGSFFGLNKSVKTHNLNPISCLVKTKLHAHWGLSVKKPAMLRKIYKEKNVCNPMDNALRPYATPVQNYNLEEVARAAHQVLIDVSEHSVECERKIFSFKEACAGVPGTSINGIPRNTSPGYPYVMEGHTNKKAFFGKQDAYSFDSLECEKLQTEVMRVVGDAANGIRNFHVFIDFLKDELRSPEKADMGLTRLISSAPLVYTIAFRMYFLAFTSAIQDCRIRNGIAVGINPYTEWNYLATHLQSKGPSCVAGDFKGFDSSEQPDIHWSILDIINAWYDDGPVNALIRRVLWCEVVHSRHLGGLDGKLDTIYQWNKSLPSGHPATSIINSLYNRIVFRMVWTRIMGFDMTTRFKEFVYLCVYGDDNILNISDEVIGKFNQDTISRTMLDIGMIYTNENKDGNVAKQRPLSQVSFLKRSFRFEERLGKYVGPQELDSILFVPYWCKNKAMLDDITLCNVEFTYTELSLHGDFIWDSHADKIRSSVKQVFGVLPKNVFTRHEYLKVSQDSPFVWPL